MISDPSDRLKEIVSVVYGGKVVRFANALGWKAPAVYKYLRGQRSFGKSFLYELERLGFSWVWIETGEGGMFANNEVGRELRRQFRSAEMPEELIEGESPEGTEVRLVPRLLPGVPDDVIFRAAAQRAAERSTQTDNDVDDKRED